jgi:hypothetical protein
MNCLDSLKSYWASRVATEKLAKHNQPSRINEGRRVNSLNKTVTNTSSYLENNLNADQLKKDLATRTIQRFFKKNRASKAYKHMFDNGEYFKQYKEISPEPKPLLENLKIAQKLSDKAINHIKNYLGKLSKQEQDFVKKVTSLSKPTLIHKTIYDLDYLNRAQTSTLTIKSKLSLAKLGVKHKSFTKKEDIQKLSNDDFVFTSLDFVGTGLNTKPELYKAGDSVEYGNKAYLTHKKPQMLGYLTLTDHYCNEIVGSAIRSFYCNCFPGLAKAIFKPIHGALGPEDIPIFTEDDMLLGVALYAIKIIRETNYDELNQYIYEDDISLTQLNEFLHVIFTPEFHIPRILSTTDFKLHKLREITAKEVYKLVIFHKQPDMIRQHYLAGYSTKNELINITTPKDIEHIREALKEIDTLMQEAISDGNSEVLSYSMYWYEKITNAGYSNLQSSSIGEYKVAISILQRNIDKISEYASKLQSEIMLFKSLRKLLLQTEDFNDEIYWCLRNISQCHSQFELEMLIELYVMINKIESIPDNIMKSISIYNISNKLVDYEYKNFSLEYAKLAAKLIMQDKDNAERLAFSSPFAGTQHLPTSRLKIRANHFFNVLCHPDITPKVRDTLQQAFVNSGVLNPEKKIKASKDLTLRDYAKEHYNIDL